MLHFLNYYQKYNKHKNKYRCHVQPTITLAPQTYGFICRHMYYRQNKTSKYKSYKPLPNHPNLSFRFSSEVEPRGFPAIDLKGGIQDISRGSYRAPFYFSSTFGTLTSDMLNKRKSLQSQLFC